MTTAKTTANMITWTPANMFPGRGVDILLEYIGWDGKIYLHEECTDENGVYFFPGDEDIRFCRLPEDKAWKYGKIDVNRNAVYRERDETFGFWRYRIHSVGEPIKGRKYHVYFE